ncbi:MAG TPA: putative Ig domain-containing protein, partial [Gammaproteobacteria bacterium]|nr:putative Ig domain-containing protein [Gammaproteobacteria bacterium]
MLSDSTASFNSTLKVKGKEYPLVLKVKGGIDLVTGSVPDFQMLSVMQNPSNKQVNITPFSTLAVLVAERMPGGLDSANVDTAMGYVTDRLGFGLNSALITDPITDVVSDENIANLVKSSETFGEMVRRPRDSIVVSGRYITGDEVMLALAEDMIDGKLDGQGAPGVDITISAVAHVVSAQVLVESLGNNLKVGGVAATGVIDQAILTTRPQVAASQLTDSVRVTAGMLQQAQRAMAAAQVVDGSAELQGVSAAVDSVSPDSLPDEVGRVLPADSSTVLDNALIDAAYASQDELLDINLVANGGAISGGTGSSGSGSDDGSGGATGTTTTQNSDPVITGSPAQSIVAGESYLFQPVASDADNDALTYSVTNLPGWADFSTTTGLMSGIPDLGDVGNYSNISISVSDGIATANLAAFNISVTAPVVVNTPPTISGVPASAVVADSSYVFQPSATDVDGDQLSFSITNRPVWASFNTTSGRLAGTPDAGDAGSYKNIVISVSDGKDSVSLPAFDVVVTVPVVVNNPPVIAGVPGTSVVANSGYLFQPNASDADNDPLTYSVSNLPVWAAFDISSGRLSGTPGDGDVGSYNNIVIS